uniref:Ankyrin repeat domain-containing protein 6 n=1 Tax=Romanomermis culicivorax TaxID=13658 RepID=A0A915K751_ROMCU
MLLFRKANGKSALFRSLNADLRLAAGQGDAAEVLELLKKGAKFIPNKEGRTALHLAAANGHAHIVQILVEHGCDLNHKDKLGYTALHRACFDGFEEIVRLLVDANGKVDEQDCVQENTALHEAASRGYTSCVELLLKAKANVYIRNKTGATALHSACQNGYNQSCKLLLQHGCKTNVKDKYDDTPLHTACRYLHIGVAKILLSESIPIDEQNKNGDTALHLSTNMGQKKLSKILFEYGASISIKNHQGETPMDIAVRKQHLELIHLFKQNPTKLQSQDKEQEAPKLDRKWKSKIRERLKLSQQDPDSTWKVLFHDWSTPSSNNDFASKFPPTASHSGDEQNLPSRPLPIIELLKPSPRKVNNCNCAPFFYRLAKHADEAHRELLEEIDACHMNLNGEICDLRQITERKLTDLNNSIKMRLLRERANCAQQIKKHLNISKFNGTQKYDLKARLIRSKSESELETDVERGRTSFGGGRRRLPATTEETGSYNSNNSGSGVLVPGYNSLKRCYSNNKKSSRNRYTPSKNDFSLLDDSITARDLILASPKNLSPTKSSRASPNNHSSHKREKRCLFGRPTHVQQQKRATTTSNRKHYVHNVTKVSSMNHFRPNAEHHPVTTSSMDDSTENFNETSPPPPTMPISRRPPLIRCTSSLYSCDSSSQHSTETPAPLLYLETEQRCIDRSTAATLAHKNCEKHSGAAGGLSTPGMPHQPPSVDSGYGTKLETSSGRLTLLESPSSSSATAYHPSSSMLSLRMAGLMERTPQKLHEINNNFETEDTSPLRRLVETDYDIDENYNNSCPSNHRLPLNNRKQFFDQSKSASSSIVRQSISSIDSVMTSSAASSLRLVAANQAPPVDVHTQTDQSERDEEEDGHVMKNQYYRSNPNLNSVMNGSSHEYTELECMLKSTRQMQRQPPTINIPPPPTKPLPPLPRTQVKLGGRRPKLTTNV